jgi:protein-disulfide isomerase
MKRYLPFIIIALVLIAGVAVFAVMYRGGTDGADSNLGLSNSNQPAQLAGSSTAPNQPAPNPSADSTGLTKPNVKVSSPVIIEEYGDYQCPPCGLLHPQLKDIEHEYRDQVRIVFRHFPLMKMHKNALAAAHAAEAARNQNKFSEMHDRLYRNQKEWAEQVDPRPTFVAYARQLNLNIDQFTSDMGSNLIDQRITADVSRGTAAGVTGTPTVFIDTLPLPYESTTPAGLRQAINAMLSRKAAP